MADRNLYKKGSQTRVLKCAWAGASLSITTVIPHCPSSCLWHVMCFREQSHVLAYATCYAIFGYMSYICDVKSNSLCRFILTHGSHSNLSSWIIAYILDLKIFWTKGRKDTTRMHFLTNFQTQLGLWEIVRCGVADQTVGNDFEIRSTGALYSAARPLSAIWQ